MLRAMKTKTLLLGVAMASLSLPAAAGAQVAPAAAVRAHVERLATAWNAHDMAAFAGLFAEDADFVNVVGVWWKNRREIEAAHEASHKTMFKDSVLSGRVAAVKLVRPDVAVAHFVWSLLGARAPDGRAVPERKGILLFLLSNEAAGWTIRAAQNTDIVERTPAPRGPGKK